MTEKDQPQGTSPDQLLMRSWISTAVVLGLLAQEKGKQPGMLGPLTGTHTSVWAGLFLSGQLASRPCADVTAHR